VESVFWKNGKCGIHFLRETKMWNSFLNKNENVELILQ
jgi:hypothetical protein